MSKNSTSLSWYELLRHVSTYGREVSPRSMKSKEVIGAQSEVDMNRPILLIPERDLGYKFQAAEASWILDGRNDVAGIAPYSRAISQFSDDGLVFAGAYGPPVVDQLGYVVQTLESDLDTRQAVLSIWRPRPAPSKDIPCTLSLQWLNRGGKLNCVATMRSSDVWLGWPYDVFNFSMISCWILLALRYRGISLELGDLYLNAGSQHLYAKNYEAAKDIVRKYGSGLTPWEAVPKVEIWPAIARLGHPDELSEYLWAMARGDGTDLGFGELP